MSFPREINSSDIPLENKDINNFLSPEFCEDAGIIVINHSGSTLELGAMNLNYIKVKKVTPDIILNFTINIKYINLSNI